MSWLPLFLTLPNTIFDPRLWGLDVTTLAGLLEADSSGLAADKLATPAKHNEANSSTTKRNLKLIEETSES
jgi:hypothetical protein